MGVWDKFEKFMEWSAKPAIQFGYISDEPDEELLLLRQENKRLRKIINRKLSEQIEVKPHTKKIQDMR